MEKRLYLADVGGYAVSVIVDRVRQGFQDKEITDDVQAFVKQQLREMLTDSSPGISYTINGPTVVMIVGVNGSVCPKLIATPPLAVVPSTNPALDTVAVPKPSANAAKPP